MHGLLHAGNPDSSSANQVDIVAGRHVGTPRNAQQHARVVRGGVPREKRAVPRMAFGGREATGCLHGAEFVHGFKLDLVNVGAGTSQDVYGTAIETFQTFSSRGLFIPLNDYVAANTGFSDFAPSLFEQGSYKGNVNYIPIGWNNIMINYNRDLFDAAGVAYPKEGWTWDEFRQTARALTVKDASGTVTQFGYEVPNQNFFIQPWFFSNGTGALNDDWSASNMLDPKVAESLQFLYDLIARLEKPAEWIGEGDLS